MLLGVFPVPILNIPPFNEPTKTYKNSPSIAIEEV